MSNEDSQLVGSDGESRLAWYAVYTKHHHEKKVADILIKKDFDVLIPLYRTVNQWKDRKKELLLPVFPCYVFIHTNPVRKLDLLRTPGVFSMVSNAGQACVVPEQDIEMARRICTVPNRVQPHPYLSTGDLVRVHRGPFAGLKGILTRVKNEFRVVMSVDLLRKSVAIELDMSCLEAVDQTHETSVRLTEKAVPVS